MATEAWFRNPDNYIRELVEVGQCWVAWDRGLLVKKSINPDEHAKLYFGTSFDYRILLVGEQGTAELTPEHTLDNPKAVYPTWQYGDDASILEEIVEQPVGQDRKICNDLTLPPDERPVFGQEHRVVVTDLPSSSTGPGKRMIKFLRELQQDHPECIIHVHGLYSWRMAFGQGFGAADIQPRDAAAKGKVHLPSGKEERFEVVQKNPQWITPLGFKPVDLEIPRNRCMYNIKSAVWAGENYEKVFKMKTAGTAVIDTESSDADFKPPETNSHLSRHVKASEGDHFVCNTCTLQNKCKYFREGAVCSVPGAEPIPLSKMFGSRDVDSIIDGLGVLMSANTRRLQRAQEYEEMDGEVDPEVTKMFGQVFDQATKLAKLVDPGRFKTTGVNINVGQGGQAAVAITNPRQMAAAAIRALEQQGIPRDKQTPEMIQGMFEGMQNPNNQQRAIEGTVLHSREESA